MILTPQGCVSIPNAHFGVEISNARFVPASRHTFLCSSTPALKNRFLRGGCQFMPSLFLAMGIDRRPGHSARLAAGPCTFSGWPGVRLESGSGLAFRRLQESSNNLSRPCIPASTSKFSMSRLEWNEWPGRIEPSRRECAGPVAR